MIPASTLQFATEAVRSGGASANGACPVPRSKNAMRFIDIQVTDRATSMNASRYGRAWNLLEVQKKNLVTALLV